MVHVVRGPRFYRHYREAANTGGTVMTELFVVLITQTAWSRCIYEDEG